MRGVARSVTLTGVGAALVFGATHLPGSLDLDLARPIGTSGEAAAATSLVTQAEVVCPGPESLGVKGLRTTGRQSVSVFAATPPAEAIPPNLRTGTGSGTGTHARTDGARTDGARTDGTRTDGTRTDGTNGTTGSMTGGQGARHTGAGAGSLAVSGLPRGGSWPGQLSAAGRVLSARSSGARSPLLTGTGSLAPGLVATQRTLVSGGDDRALVTTACASASAQSWLIGGGAEPGRRERVVLTNPGPNPVTVDLDVLGKAGPVPSSNGRGIVVGAYDRTVVLLDAISGTEKAPAVHVAVHGGEVAAVLNDTWLDGVIPRGGDDALPVAAPAREQVIAGVAVDGRASVRIAVPGDSEAVVQTRVLTASGPQAIPAGGVLRVPGRSTRDLDLSALPADAYAVQVRADVPVVAAATVERRSTRASMSDLAWASAAAPVRSLAGAALGPAADRAVRTRIDLVAVASAATVTLTTVGRDGSSAATTIEVPADSLRVVPLADAVSVWVTPVSGSAHAAAVSWVSDAKGMQLSVTPLSDLTLTSTAANLREVRD